MVSSHYVYLNEESVDLRAFLIADGGTYPCRIRTPFVNSESHCEKSLNRSLEEATLVAHALRNELRHDIVANGVLD